MLRADIWLLTFPNLLFYHILCLECGVEAIFLHKFIDNEVFSTIMALETRRRPADLRVRWQPLRFSLSGKIFNTTQAY